MNTSHTSTINWASIILLNYVWFHCYLRSRERFPLGVRFRSVLPYIRIRLTNLTKIWCVARDPIVTIFTRVGGGVTTFARACPVSLSRKPLSPGTEATSKTELSLSRSLVHRQTWRLTGTIHADSLALFALNIDILHADVTKPEMSNILTLTWPVTLLVTPRSLKFAFSHQFFQGFQMPLDF